MIGWDAKELARQQRQQFAEMLSGLSEVDWQAPTLCPGWRVHDVVAHVISYLDRSRIQFAAEIFHARGRIAQLNDAGIRTHDSDLPEQLCQLMRLGATPTGIGASCGGRVALLECLIHQQDICRPLGQH